MSRGHKVTDGMRRKIKNLASDGIYGTVIAKEMGLSPATVSEILSKAGQTPYKRLMRDGQAADSDPAMHRITRVKGEYSNFQREEYINKLLKNEGMILKKRHTEIKPEEGDYKTTIHFAWWPVWIGNERIWLEKYKRIHEYVRRRRTFFIGAYMLTVEDCGGWDEVQIKRITH